MESCDDCHTGIRLGADVEQVSVGGGGFSTNLKLFAGASHDDLIQCSGGCRRGKVYILYIEGGDEMEYKCVRY